jgi:predicted ABC-type ATPase
MTDRRPNVIVLAGPNGAGKSTAAPGLLSGVLHVSEFVNADVIAQGLSRFRPEGAAIAAGRIMLCRLKELAAQRLDFAFETTLASKTFGPFLRNLTASGYGFHLVFFWLDSPELAVTRVGQRIAAGGHMVPEEDIRRRYRAGLQNFFRIYRPLTRNWKMYDNSKISGPMMIAEGSGVETESVHNSVVWEQIRTYE